MSRAELCLTLGIAPRTLDAWQRRGIAPPAVHLTARCVRYRLADVRAWLAARQGAAA
ncbi:AlpA family phage regulatory protein [bacterium]|nr:AlpA family phage regulatory protein [bacterium]